MDKKIPLYFDSIIIDSPSQNTSTEPADISRVKVRVFTKYKNRNGSYITDAVANQLIESATQGNIPVVGFFDPETGSWASHSGPTLANGYGYVDSFLGWEPFEDTDGITREYAVFSVILFTDYYDEAKRIYGQNQSMELDPASITGDWTLIENEEYFVYKTAKMLGFCVIGEHEPCFSVSSFFEKNDGNYINQYEKFSSLLLDLKAKLEENEKKEQGGKQLMNEFNNQEVTEENIQNAFTIEENVQNTSVTEENTEFEQKVEDNSTNDYELLQKQYNELQNSFEELQQKMNEAQSKISEYESFQENSSKELEDLRKENTQFQTAIETYKNQIAKIEIERKNNLIEKYSEIINSEEIEEFKEKINDFSYDELESKLAILYANSNFSNNNVKKIPSSRPEETPFARLMSKYRK